MRQFNAPKTTPVNSAQPEADCSEHPWQSVLAELKECVPGPSFDTWLKGTTGAALVDADGILVDDPTVAAAFVVSTPNSFVSEMLERRMYSLISQGVEKVLDRPVAVSFEEAGR